MNVWFLGAGRIGRRHIESTFDLQTDFTFHIIEKDYKNINEINKMVESKTNYHCHKSLPVGQQIDLLFLANNATDRYEVFKQIQKENKVKNIIFEKVVFQTPLHYLECFNIIEEFNIKSWINNWPRCAAVFKDIKKSIPNSSSVSINVTGPLWGLGCNSSHFIDLLAFLSGENDLNVMDCDLYKVYDSNRIGFIDFSGEIVVESESGNAIHLGAYENEKKGIFIEIISDEKKFFVELADQKMFLTSDFLNVYRKSYEPHLHSKMSKNRIYEILRDDTSELPAYRDVYQWHSSLISNFNTELGLDHHTGVCPIT